MISFLFILLLGLDTDLKCKDSVKLLENLCLDSIIHNVQYHKGSIPFNDAVFSLNIPNFFHQAIISKHTAEIEDFIFEYYYADCYVHDLGIDSDDPDF